MEAEQKKILKPLVLALRHLLEGRYDEHGAWQGGDLEARMNSLGVWWDRDPIPVDEVTYQSKEDQHARKVIDAYLKLRNEAGIKRREAIEEYVRETAYTWANRLLILRCMEARDLIDPQVVLTKEVYGGRSQAHNRLVQQYPERCRGLDGGLFAMLEEAFAQHAKHLPLLFDPKAPGVALRPSVAAIKKCIGLLSGTESLNGNGSATDEVFAAPDALGWAYQYWNTEEKDRVFEKVRTKKVKIQGADIISATQLYTEPYMVKFLVQNSLGATWMGMYPDSNLLEEWEYYVKDADRAPVRKKNVENITFLDPACGSGHFLIEAFDLFFQMYKAEGKYTDEETICKKILTRNLYGIDIDERAVQIARAALWMRAAERVFDFKGTPKNIIATNIRLPKGKDHLKEFLAKHPEDAPLEPALETIFEGLAHADELGSLLQIEEPVERELRHLRERLGGQTTLSTGGLTGQTSFTGPMTDEDWEAWKDGVVERLADHFKEEAEAANLVNAFFSQNAGKGVRLFELLSKRYDVVAANPPYMGSGNMAAMTKNYIQTQYVDGKHDLYSAFILRNILLSAKNGKIAMVTQQSWLFLRSFANLRAHNENMLLKSDKSSFKGVLRQTNFETLVHLGPRAFNEISGEVVNSILFILSNNTPTLNHTISSIRTYESQGVQNKELKVRRDCKSILFKTCQLSLLSVPESPVLYFWSTSDLEILQGNIRLGEYLSAKHGLSTCCNDRFLRWNWEVNSQITNRWNPYVKGGGYRKWTGLEYYYVDWEHDGERIKNSIVEKYPYLKGNYGFVVTNEETYKKRGLTFTQMCSGSLGVRLLENSIYDVKSEGLFKLESEFSPLDTGWMVILNSRIVSYLLRCTTQSNEFKGKYVDNLWIPNEIENYLPIFSEIAHICLILKNKITSEDYLEKKYTLHKIGANNVSDYIGKKLESEIQTSSLLHSIEGIGDRLTYKAYELTDSLNTLSVENTGTPSGWYPIIRGYDKIPPLRNGIPQIPPKLLDLQNKNEKKTLLDTDLINLKKYLRTLFEAGPGAKVESGDDCLPNEGDGETIAGAYIPIPPETYLEELSQKLQIHPISVYWLLKEGIEQEGWRCIPEEQRIIADRFMVTILRVLGHRWPKQIEAGEPVPEWADADGIIPLTSGAGEETLLERLRERIAVEFPGRSVSAIEREFEEVMGKSLEDWLHIEFFKHHTKQFKKRPIAWQVQSGKFTKKKQPAFTCMVYYHKLDEDTLYKIKNQYVGPLRQKYETEMRGIEGIPAGSRSETQEKRYRELGDLIAELKVFGETLTEVAESGFASKALDKIAKKEPLDAWCSIDGAKAVPADIEAFLRQECSYIPDINDGVRVNVAPLQKAGLLAGDVIAKKDLEKAISDRAEWRADERRWCREGKLPRCGWWPQEEEP